MAVCQKCIIPDTFPGVTIENGLCSFCRDSLIVDTANRGINKPELLEQLLKQQKKADKNGYDCLVPVSGGKDSAYVLYYTVKRLGLKPFAVFFESGFASALAKQNVANICSRLGVDWTTVKFRESYRRQAAIDSVHMSKITGCFYHVCANCENNLRTMAIRTALEKQTKYILWGATDYEDAVYKYNGNKKSLLFREGYGKSSFLLPVLEFFTGPGFPLLYRSPHHLISQSCCIIMDNFSSKSPGGLKKLNPKYQVIFGGDAEVVYFFDYIDYNPVRHVKTLKSELGWESSASREARFDCKLHCLANYSFARVTSISKDGFNMANLVRAGLMERTEALGREKKIRDSLESECIDTLRFLGFDDYKLERVPDIEEQYTGVLNEA